MRESASLGAALACAMSCLDPSSLCREEAQAASLYPSTGTCAGAMPSMPASCKNHRGVLCCLVQRWAHPCWFVPARHQGEARSSE